MLNSCRPLLVTRRAMKYGTKLKQRFRNPSRIPITQTNQQRRETIQQILRTRRVNPGRESEYFYVEKKLFSRTARLDREDGNVNNVFALQGLGDLEPLRNSANFGLSEREMLKFDSPADIAKHSPPPIPFTPLAARKLADGKLWPAATEPTGMMSKEVRLLRHESNMSPSARAFGEKVAFHLRRSLRACPGHIGERIDFAQLVIQEVVASRRSKQIYIVWSTVDPGARFELEPLLHRLNYWVQRLIVNRIKTRPHIPHVNWIYDGGRLERELPRDLKTELTSLVGETRSTLEERVKYLKELDTINQRMKNIPWFMPYLWNKDDKARRQKLMETDLETMESRQAAVGGGSRSGRGSAQSSYTVDRGSPSQTSPPPTFVR